MLYIFHLYFHEESRGACFFVSLGPGSVHQTRTLNYLRYFCLSHIYLHIKTTLRQLLFRLFEFPLKQEMEIIFITKVDNVATLYLAFNIEYLLRRNLLES